MSTQSKLARPAVTAANQPAADTRARIAPFPDQVALPEQVIGSSHELAVVEPRVIDPHPVPAYAFGRIRPTSSATPGPAPGPVQSPSRLTSNPAALAELDAESFHVGWHAGAPAHIPADAAVPALQVQFAPRRAGAHAAILDVILRWQDGKLETRPIQLHARARSLLDAREPTPEPALQPRDVPARPPHDYDQVSVQDRTALANATALVIPVVHDMSSAQRRAVSTVDTEAKTYAAPLPPRSGWAELAEIALTIAVGGIAGIVARHFGAVLGTMLSSRVQAVVSLDDRHQRLLREYSVQALTDSIKDGLKATARSPMVRAAIAAPFVSATGAHNATQADRAPERQMSRNPRINFFAALQDGISKVERANEELVHYEHQRLQWLAVTDPARAIAVMNALKEGFHRSAGEAHDRQALETSKGWVTLVARSNHGDEQARSSSTSATQSVTRLDDVRRLGSADPRRGIITFELRFAERTRDVADETFQVEDVRLNGVAQLVANRLLDVDLGTAQMPIAVGVRFGGSRTMITRDEAGRVRVGYGLPVHDAGAGWNEAQLHRSASTVVDRLLSRSLRAWGLDHLPTDDTTPPDLPGSPRTGNHDH